MITPAYCQMMARYNAWQNHNLITAAGTLDGTARRQDRGAFFGSIEETLNHLLWGDRIWLRRFAGSGKPSQTSIPDSRRETPDWTRYCAARAETDAQITTWAAHLTDDELEGDLSWVSGAINRQVTKPLASLIAHFFNHQTHHRGQVHAMLTAAGATPSDTDLFLLPLA